MEKIYVDLKEKSYNIEIEKNIFESIGKKIKERFSYEKIVIITDETVYGYYGNKLENILIDAGFKVNTIQIKPGEESKSLQVAEDIYEKLVAYKITRSDLVLAFGGGVVGDLGGFIASTFLRGLDFIQVPTTLLSQIDSSVGGKVAVNLKSGKNLVGSFYQPKEVYIDTELLKTLDKRYLRDGLAEAIKYGAIKNEYLFNLLETIEEEKIFDYIDEIVSICCKIKRDVVQNDEFDKGERMILNFGHTVGHGVEKYYNYKTYTHGEGVGIGMYRITSKTEELKLTEEGTTERIKNILKKYKLPVEIPLSKEDVIKNILSDKKQDKSKITIIVLDKIGKVKLLKIDFNDLGNYIN